MLSIRSLAGDSADPAGVQLEMQFLAGAVRTSPDSPDVTVEMNFPAGKVATSSPDPK